MSFPSRGRRPQALPICVANPESAAANEKQTLIWRVGGTVFLSMRRRKNRPSGSGKLARICCCKGGASPMCPVHTLWDRFLAHLPEGAEPWKQVSAAEALHRLRRLLQKLAIPSASKYRTHDLRRGHAEDMRQCGCTMAEILQAGQWKSSAFL